MRLVMHRAVVFVFVVALPGCFAGKTSPAQYGLDLRVAPGFPVGDAGVTIHPTLAYARSLFGGVEGEDDGIFHVGGQVRFAPQRTGTVGSGLWFGGEVTYARRRTTFDFAGAAAETTNGWTIAALVGLPLLDGTAGSIHGYAAAGLNKYGGSGPYARVGVDLQPAFLKR